MKSRSLIAAACTVLAVLFISLSLFSLWREYASTAREDSSELQEAATVAVEALSEARAAEEKAREALLEAREADSEELEAFLEAQEAEEEAKAEAVGDAATENNSELRRYASTYREAASVALEVASRAREDAAELREDASAALETASWVRELATKAEGNMVQAQANADGRNASLWERAANAQGDLRTARIKAAAAYEVHAEWLEAAATAHEAGGMRKHRNVWRKRWKRRQRTKPKSHEISTRRARARGLSRTR